MKGMSGGLRAVLTTAGVLALTASTVRANFSQNFNADPSLTGEFNVAGANYASSTFDDGLINAGFPHYTFTGNSGGIAFTASTSVVAGLGAGGAGDNAVEMNFIHDPGSVYWFGGFVFHTTLDANVVTSQNLADISIFADVKAPAGSDFAIKVEWGNGPYSGGGAWEFHGTGNGAWQNVGGLLSLATPHFANPGGDVFLFDRSEYQFVAAFRNELATWGDGGTLLVDNIVVTGMTNLNPNPPADADFDNDGDTDGNDLLIWQRGLGLSGGAATNAAGNADGDSDVDAQDLAAWKGEFGSATPVVASVPEPGGLSLTGLMTLGLAGLRRVRRRRQGLA